MLWNNYFTLIEIKSESYNYEYCISVIFGITYKINW